VPILPSPGQPSPPPAGAQVGAEGLHLSEAPGPNSFPRTKGAQGRGREEQLRGRRTENKREGDLEQKTLGPEPGVSGTAPTSTILSNCLTTGQNLWAYFYSRRNRVKWNHRWEGEEINQTPLVLDSPMLTPKKYNDGGDGDSSCHS
jgi:hypothetical protein